MNRRVLGIFCVIFIIVVVFGAGTALGSKYGFFEGYPIVKMIVDGEEIAPEDVPAIMLNGRTMVPLRFVSDALGAVIEWDGTEYAVSISREEAAAGKDIDTTRPGYARTAPAPLGTTLEIEAEYYDVYQARLTLLEVLRGNEAWEKVRDASYFNEAAKDNHEYLLARFSYTLLDIEPPDANHYISPSAFTAVSKGGVVYADSWTMEPEPSLSAELYAGATHEGWVIFEVYPDDEPLIVYGREGFGRGGIWWTTDAVK